MTIIAADHNGEDLRSLSVIIKELCPEADFRPCGDSLEALAEARKTDVDIAFLAVSMPELNGLDLGRYLKELHPYINLIFLAENRRYAYEAIGLRSSGFILKPCLRDVVKVELNELRYPEERKRAKRVFVQTFGNFEIFVDGRPVNFKYNKTKEMVAVLVNNRGAQTTNGEIIASLWEDDGDPEKKTSYLSNLRQDLQNTFTRLKLNGIILKQRGSLAVAADRIECDLYEWLEKKKESKYQYIGDYMNQYSWPEFVHAELDELNYALYDE